MKNSFVFILLFTLLPVVLFSVNTRYITDFRFDNIEFFESSNVSFIENGGLELSRSYSVLFQTDDLLWDVINWNGRLLASAGDTATLLSVSEKTNYPLYKNKDHILFSDIKIWKDRLYLSAIPKAAVYRMGKDFQPEQKIAVSNNYIWQMVPTDAGMFLLTGNPASLLLLQENGTVQQLAVLPAEDNLLKGVILDKDLYFIGDGNVLYRFPADLRDNKTVAVASFDNPVSDILSWNGKIYVITAPKEPSRNLSGSAAFNAGAGDDDANKNPSADKRNTRNMSGRSAVFSYSPAGYVEEIFDRNNVRFLSLNAIDGSLIVGTDRSAGYFELPLTGENKRRFTAAGKGKFARMTGTGGELYGVLLEPSRIIRIDHEFSAKGTFISSPFDTGNISSWGKFDTESDLLPSTGIRIFSRSGAVNYEGSWEDWRPVTDKVESSPNRFFQYRIELSSADGKNTPQFRELVVPYVQKNLPPKIEKLNLEMSSPGSIKVSWEATDDNKDTLVYDLYLAKIEQDWVKINEKPVEETSFEINQGLFPAGKYRLKLTASDERSNPASQAKKTFKVSEPFLIDNIAPEISGMKFTLKNGECDLQFSAADTLSDIADAQYSLNGGKWVRFLPVDGLFDSKNKNFELKLRVKTPCFLQVKVSDVYGNDAVKGITIGNDQ